jgi:luciferase-like monooxygenase
MPHCSARSSTVVSECTRNSGLTCSITAIDNDLPVADHSAAVPTVGFSTEEQQPHFWGERTVGLKFGFLFSIRNPRRWEKPWPQAYGEMLEQVTAAENLGFDSVWMSEHHGAEDGYCPSTLVAAAARTSHITIGVRLLLLPLQPGAGGGGCGGGR